MNAWIILVRFKDGEVNVSQEGYRTYQEVVREVRSKNSEYLKQVDDYNFIDEEYNIHYEIKALFVK